jgi:hypothetical protein
MSEQPKESIKRGPPQSRVPIEGAVAKILTARELVINRGDIEGVKVGMKFQVLDPKAENIKDPETGKTLGSIERPKVEVEVTRVAEHLSIAQTFHASSVNVGGAGLGVSSLMRQFEPPKYDTVYETLKTNEATWEDLDESKSFVKIGDPVREIISDAV